MENLRSLLILRSSWLTEIHGFFFDFAAVGGIFANTTMLDSFNLKMNIKLNSDVFLMETGNCTLSFAIPSNFEQFANVML